MKSPALSLLALVLMPLCVFAQTPKAELISPQVKAAVEKAVKWLVAQQRPAGLIVDEKSNNTPKRGDLPSHSAAMTSLALMGLASVGHMPSDPTPEGKAAAKALRYIVEGIEPDSLVQQHPLIMGNPRYSRVTARYGQENSSRARSPSVTVGFVTLD